MYDTNYIHSHHGSAIVPEWASGTLAALFVAGAFFYLFRLLRPDVVRRRLGYWDWENEVGHGLCMLAMAAMLAPSFVPIPVLFWLLAFPVGAAWFIVRAFTWGRRLPCNKVSNDLVHSGMLLGMFLMFQPLTLGAWFTIPQVAFWAWFAGHYIRELRMHGRTPVVLQLGSDACHLMMGAVMAGMIMFPAAMILVRTTSMARMSGSVAEQTAGNPSRGDDGVSVLDDRNFTSEVFGTKEPVAVLVFGGCEKCAEEVRIFDSLAHEYTGQPIKFVRISKDESPRSCKMLNVEECPRVCVVTSTGITVAGDKVDVTRTDDLRSFIDRIIK